MFLMTEEALTSLAKKVPDLLDYTDDCKIIDFSKDVNSQLYNLAGLTTEEINYVESNIRRSEASIYLKMLKTTYAGIVKYLLGKGS